MIIGSVIAAVLTAFSFFVVWATEARRELSNLNDDLGTFPFITLLIVTTIAFGLALIQSPALPGAVAVGLGLGALAAAAVVDARIGLIPNVAVAAIAFAGVIDAIIARDIVGPIVGVIAVVLLMGALRGLKVWRAGAGDVKLGIALGVWLTGLLGAAALLVGLLGVQIYIAVRRRRSTLPVHGRVGFAPFILLGVAGVVVFAIWPDAWTLAFRGAP